MSEEQSGELREICDRLWQWQITEMPEFGTYCGFPTDESSLDPYNEHFYFKKKKHCQDLLDSLDKLQESYLARKEVITLLMLRRYANCFLDGIQWQPYLHGINYWEGPDYYLTLYIRRMTFQTELDYFNYLERLRKFPKTLEDLTVMMRKGIKENIVHYKLSVEGLVGRMQGHTELDPTQSFFYEPFVNMPAAVPPKIQLSLQEQAQEIIKSKIYPAMRQMASFVSHEYIANCRPEPSITSIPGGKDRYLAYVRFYSDWEGTLDELHQFGLQEAMKDIGFHGSMKELKAHMESMSHYFFNSREEFLAYIDDLMNNRIRPVLKHFFPETPNLPLRIEFGDKAIPALGIYNAPTQGKPGESQTGQLQFTPNLNVLPKYMLTSLILHEAEPGHHMQACYAMNDSSLPAFRKYKEDRRYFEVPARFPMNAAYTEGWGLYCECLGEEMGIYKDTYDILGYLTQDLKRAIRVVVDTGIHAQGWSEEHALAYMTHSAPFEESSAKSEIKRYITWPGQACAYKVGHAKIRHLRKKAERELGDKFDIKKFHEVCLSCGQVPLDILDNIVHHYINSYK